MINTIIIISYCNNNNNIINSNTEAFFSYSGRVLHMQKIVPYIIHFTWITNILASSR